MPMDRNRQEIRTINHADPGIGGMLLLSLGFHLLIAYLFLGVLTPRFQRELRPVYYVDLITPPVADPQAGRPDGAPEPVEAPPTPRPEPPKPPPQPQPPKPEVKPAPAPKAAPKPEPKPESKPEPKISAADEKALAETMRRLQAKQEREDLKRTLSQLTTKDTRQAESAAKPAPSAAPIGEATGKGTEKGFAHGTWLQGQLTEAWRYSPYLAPERLDLEATLSLHFDGSGKFLFYRIEKSSGNEQFDQSIIRAIIKLFKDQPLPNPPKEPSRFEVTFNLKDLKR